ncbi:TPA: Ig family protein, partial [Pseudomonas aeruginosa]|nr:Ig family protein [Pseudomonas aeruginosa]HCE7578280.1 Ig family protein [Pseudomonas aeruginosa]HCE7923839.1 Ig family protein [Pseudomonas aeruginosa]HCE8243021.1 Ig family protein [Pseudomonas aeruginosa]HCE8594113.1 Ig family protein [Pseudomonas aeruginosa]
EVSIVGAGDKVRVANWDSADSQLETFIAADGYTLTNQAVLNLVQAMAAFSPPRLGVTDIPVDIRSALEPVIAANWQA